MRSRIRKASILSMFGMTIVALSVLAGCAQKAKILAATVDRGPGGGVSVVVALVAVGSALSVAATVTVFGQDIPPSYLGNVTYGLLPAPDAGQDVPLLVSYEDVFVMTTLTMPTKPLGLSNTGNSVSATIRISWTAVAPTPDNVTLFIPSRTVSGEIFSVTLAGNATFYDIPANTLVSGQPIIYVVEAENKTANLGSSVMEGSTYQVGNQSDSNFVPTS